MILRKGLIAAACLLAGVTVAGADAVAPDQVKIEDGTVKASLTGAPGNPENGRKLFADRKLGNCLACHTNSDLKKELFHGEVGPVLDGVADRWEPEQLRAILVNSKAVFGAQTVMPAFYRIIEGQRVAKDFVGKTILSADQVEDIVAYLSTLKGK